jgi:fumarate hydratase, class II
MADRIERDSLGEVRVPEGALYGAQTQRAVENFPISGRTMPSQVIRALARIKASCASANRAIGRLDAERASIIRAKSLEIAAGEYAEHFPIDVFQTGSGTSTNMNLNEVIARIASTPELKMHPNDHVNMGQSSNDVIPTAVHVAARDAINEVLEPGLARLAGSLGEAAKRYDDVVALGRTHTMDAMPRRIGQLLGGHAAMIEAGRARVRQADEALAEVALGGTAVGTGYSAPRAFVDAALSELSKLSGHTFREAPNHFAAQGGIDAIVFASATVRGVAISMAKIAGDLRWLAAGPIGGPFEIRFKSLQPGSSIMPGKVNPVMAEVAIQVTAQVIGNDAAIAYAGASGILDLNTFFPLVADNLISSITLVGRTASAFAERAVETLEVDRERCAELVEKSGMLVTALAPKIGYDAAAEIAKEAQRTGRTIREVAKAKGVLSPEEIDKLLDPRSMT